MTTAEMDQKCSTSGKQESLLTW